MLVFSTVESLELRQMLSVGRSGGDGVLSVKGTTGNDQIMVSVDPSNAADIRVTMNGASSDFAAAKVKTVKVDGDRGNDSIKLDESKGRVTKGMYFLGGAGSDTLVSGSANDVAAGRRRERRALHQGREQPAQRRGRERQAALGQRQRHADRRGRERPDHRLGRDEQVVGVSRSDIVTKAALPSSVPTAVGSTSTPTPPHPEHPEHA